MLSQTCKTAVKAVLFLALKYEKEEKAGIKEIAEYLNASEHTVGKMLQTLVRRGIINSLKGPAGGFYISKLQQDQPIINIVKAIDGENVFKNCGLGLSKCSATHPCPIHNEYKEARDIMERIFKTKNVADLCAPVNNGLAYLAG
jgi:Rrf2 family protein